MSSPQSMTTDHHHPGDETLAAYAEGKLSGSERDDVERHVASCEECYAIWQGDVEFLAHEAPASGKVVQGRFGPAWLAIAAVIAAAFLITPIRERLPGFEPTGMRALAEAWGRLDKRPIQGRLSEDFPYRKPDSKRSGAGVATSPWMEALAEQISLDPKSDAQEKATALLLLRKWDQAAAALEQQLAAEGPDAELLNDLGVAYLQKSDYDRALDAIDRGLAIEKTPALLFNRALVFLHRRDLVKARAAWDEYLKADPDSAWASEARDKRELTE